MYSCHTWHENVSKNSEEPTNSNELLDQPVPNQMNGGNSVPHTQYSHTHTCKHSSGGMCAARPGQLCSTFLGCARSPQSAPFAFFGQPGLSECLLCCGGGGGGGGTLLGLILHEFCL